MTVLPSAGERYLSTVLFNHLFSQVHGSLLLSLPVGLCSMRWLGWRWLSDATAKLCSKGCVHQPNTVGPRQPVGTLLQDAEDEERISRFTLSSQPS